MYTLLFTVVSYESSHHVGVAGVIVCCRFIKQYVRANE